MTLHQNDLFVTISPSLVIPPAPPGETNLLAEGESIFRRGAGDVFEDGMESAFSRELQIFLKEYGNKALSALSWLIQSERCDPEVVSEALRWVGRVEDPDSENSRLQLLEQSLLSPSPRVRDGAALGLASMDDPGAIPVLEHAIRAEPLPDLREDMQQVLEQLRETAACLRC